MKIIDIIGISEADLIRMEEGKKELPVGVSRMSGGRNGWRLHRTVNGKLYRFGTFQNLEHALRTNVYIGRMVDDIRDELASKPLSKEELESVIGKQNEFMSIHLSLLVNRILELASEKKSFLQRVMGR